MLLGGWFGLLGSKFEWQPSDHESGRDELLLMRDSQSYPRSKSQMSRSSSLPNHFMVSIASHTKPEGIIRFLWLNLLLLPAFHEG
jgi:hypothetical protein